LTGVLGTIGRIAQAVDLAPVVDAGQGSEGWGTYALLVTKSIRKNSITKTSRPERVEKRRL